MTIETPTDELRGRILRSAELLKSLFEHKLELSLEVLTKPPQELECDGVQFDMTIHRYGIWGIKASKPLTEKTQAEIAATFHGLLGAIHTLDGERQNLAQLQDRLETVLPNLPSNVIPLRRKTLQSANVVSAVNDRRYILKLDCLIESMQAADIHKMAIELHTQSRRYAFLEYGDLDRSTRLNLSELLQLGAVTLFIPSILQLDLEEQRVLKNLIEQNTLERPLLMVGAHIPFSDLRSEPAIHLEFLLLLSRAYIKLSKPFSEYKDKGLIHYFLDSMSQNPS